MSNPGSPEAIATGCTCPVMDNHHGEGIPYGEGIAFYTNVNCPIHQTKSEIE